MLPCRHIHRPVPHDRGDRNCVEYIPMTLHGRIYSLATNVLQTGRHALHKNISLLIIKNINFHKPNKNSTVYLSFKFFCEIRNYLNVQHNRNPHNYDFPDHPFDISPFLHNVLCCILLLHVHMSSTQVQFLFERK